ncbi:DUF2089 domain-containing protein [Truepera radiovictrix]|uniref:DUF2089 domain-containing protein n=1 Tax=Truepera radiovictrix (strain DSM 17093 / CIP 108686 / LMG 22925 / RQ-24) TaxID=649638 RepID=D7CRY4_TRURR|nr:DUF2089 domain-containing protein [Truepera radiovictrix]ADI15312.1 Protein of unknown function DUF2089 [Truepera radiovictrix DSM 17093]WMT56137.1 DUF2089 domain-containing protein [Truepera radiovictrix]
MSPAPDAKPLPMPTRCPVTGQPLEVTRLECPESGVTIEGRFVPNEFALLNGEQLEFLRLFVRVRGNLKEVERLSGVSYPTVRLRLEATLRALGYEPANTAAGDTREEVLSALERGDISAAEAAKRLRAVRR